MSEILILSDRDVRASLDLDDLLIALGDGFVALSEGRTVAPNRSDVGVPGKGFLLTMPAWQGGSQIAVKMVGVFRENAGSAPGHPALIALFDPETGAPVALMDGSYLTTMRTAGAAALSTRLLARPDARVLAIIGAGSQAAAHLQTVTRVRDFADVRIASSGGEKAASLAATHPRARVTASNEAAVQGADVVCLCTDSGVPVVKWEWISPGVHLTSVGYAAPGSELPGEAVRQGHLVVESRIAFEPAPVGCVELAGLPRHSAAELGEVLSGARPGRLTGEEITVYKSMGHAVEDMVAANLVYRAAVRTGVGQAVHL